MYSCSKIPPSGKWDIWKWLSGLQLILDGWWLTLGISCAAWTQPYKGNLKWDFCLFPKGCPGRTLHVTHLPNYWPVRCKKLSRSSGTRPLRTGCEQRGVACIRGSLLSLASLSHAWETSLPLHPEAQAGITIFPVLPLLNNSANSIRWSSDFLMFGQAVNIVILAHFNKYRQVWALVIVLLAGFFLCLFLSFLSYPFSPQRKQMCECYKIAFLNQWFFLTVYKLYIKRHCKQEGQLSALRKATIRNYSLGNKHLVLGYPWIKTVPPELKLFPQPYLRFHVYTHYSTEYNLQMDVVVLVVHLKAQAVQYFITP